MFPARVSCHELADMVDAIHTPSEFADDEDQLLEFEHFFCAESEWWRKVVLPLAAFVGVSVTDRAQVWRFLLRDPATVPPVVALPLPHDPSRCLLYDGNHRIAAARLRGDRTHEAYIPA